ncbi:uncharacterized protein [Typha angustifolia]|uniref:uncharacterized protein n=1 Tax=Typha angustifolia TaxID=59011 RepID=UPI003C2C5288
MAVFVRAKRVTDPLDEKVRARLRGEMAGYSSSGSEHEAATCLSGLVQAFLEAGSAGSEDERSDRGSDRDEEGGADRAASAAAARVRELLDPPAEMDPFRIRLVAEVTATMEAEEGMRTAGSAFRRSVMARLRAMGYDAGICKARWETSGGITAGSYEYIDVISPEKERMRYIVDWDFATGMEVARATEEYGRVVAAVPKVVVARDEAIGKAVRLMAEAARRSLRRNELHVPPWRKSRYMLAKWLGSYRRTTNPMVTGSGAPAVDVTCRAVGFHVAAADGFRVAPFARIM